MMKNIFQFILSIRIFLRSFQFIALSSNHHEISIDKKKYIKIFDINGFRFVVHNSISPTSIRLKINDDIVAQRELIDPKNIDKEAKDYINIWFQAPLLEKPKAKLHVELKFFGIFIRFKTILVYKIHLSQTDIILRSDSYIDLGSLQSANPFVKDIDSQIDCLPSVVRKMDSSRSRKKINKIIVLRLDQLGDFILTVPAILKLKNIFEGVEITALVSPANVGCARSLNLFSEIIEVPFSFQKGTNKRFLTDEAKTIIAASTANKTFDVAIDLSVMPESRSLLKLIHADYKIGFENTDAHMMDLGILLHAKDPVNLLSNISHASYPMLIVEAARLALNPDFAHIRPNPSAIMFLDKFYLKPKKYVVVHSGARNLLARWPQDRFVELATRISALGEIVVFFSDDDLPDYLQVKLQLSQILVFTGGLTFDQFDAILSFARVYIGNDTGPKHLAALRDVPVVSIHAARSNWSEWGQVDSGYTISRRVPCAGCGIETKRECGRDLVCLNNITVQEVFDCYSTMN
jgi:ADP-heptose:LPS heptosyltransferase